MSLGVYGRLERKHQKQLFLRTFFGYLSITTGLLSIQLLPESISVSIQLAQVFSSALAGWLWAGENITVCEMISIVGGFFGVLITVNTSWFASGNKDMQARDNADLVAYPYYYLGVVIATSSVALSSINFFLLRAMGGGVNSNIKTCLLYTSPSPRDS